jgi:predicted transcriptional regulator
MANYKKNPRHQILSIRVSDEELERLEQLAEQTKTSIAELMREALRNMVRPADGATTEKVKGESSI